jgi:hypothetical protein
MAKKSAGEGGVSLTQVKSFVKKDMAAMKADAKRLADFLKQAKEGPERVSIKVCDCCIKVE